MQLLLARPIFATSLPIKKLTFCGILLLKTLYKQARVCRAWQKELVKRSKADLLDQSSFFRKDNVLWQQQQRYIFW